MPQINSWWWKIRSNLYTFETAQVKRGGPTTGSQDKNAAEQRGDLTAMLLVATHNYDNRSWDLVDTCDTKNFDWQKVQDKDLQRTLRGSHCKKKRRSTLVAGKEAG
jgi:hypothetical protein